MNDVRNRLIELIKDGPNIGPNIEQRADFYIKVLEWLRAQKKANGIALVGLNGPQGCGKSTLCDLMVQVSAMAGLRTATLSIDDFYLRHTEQTALASQYPENPYLQQRGYSGTHDIGLGIEVLRELKQLADNGSVLCPHYDKSAFGGLGDRFPKTKWKNIQGPLDLLLLEGWMLGFPVVEPGLISDPNLTEVNRFLQQYQAWHEMMDAFVFLEPAEIDFVIDWRVEAEERRRVSGAPGLKNALSREEITNYVKKFIPAYRIYLPALKRDLLKRENILSFVIGKNRLPV